MYGPYKQWRRLSKVRDWVVQMSIVVWAMGAVEVCMVVVVVSMNLVVLVVMVLVVVGLRRVESGVVVGLWSTVPLMLLIILVMMLIMMAVVVLRVRGVTRLRETRRA